MPQRCCVLGCKSVLVKNNGISFHRFPRQAEKREQWLNKIGRKIDISTIDRIQPRVCSKHFDKTDFVFGGNVRKLTNKAVLKVFPRTAETTVVKNDDNANGQENVNGLTEQMSPVIIKDEMETLNAELEYLKEENNRLKLSNNKLEALRAEISYLKQENNRLRDLVKARACFSLSMFAGNNAKILFYTGFQTYDDFCDVKTFLLPSNSVDDLNIYGTPEKVEQHVSQISLENQLFLTLIRLRRGMAYETLGDMFSISKAAAEKIFLVWINFMFLKLGALDIWPHRDVLISNAPISSIQKYPNMIGSIACMEFFIQTPSFVKQSECYSQYKSGTTLKSLVMFDPSGALIYISSLYTGSISDEEIIASSGFLNILKDKVLSGEVLPGDIILADKGFNVHQMCEDKNIALNLPVFRMSAVDITPSEAERSRKVAQETVHVERAIGRLKTYRILTMKIPVTMLGTIEQIYTVCAILCNFRFPLRQ